MIEYMIEPKDKKYSISMVTVRKGLMVYKYKFLKLANDIDEVIDFTRNCKVSWCFATFPFNK